MIYIGIDPGLTGAVVALLEDSAVPPATWKKAMLGAAAGGKDAARLEALRLFPAVADQLSLKKHHGRAEALLIAEYGRRILKGA